MFKVTITDEFHSTYTFETDSSSEVARIVESWLKTVDETPIYEINIEIN